MEYLLVKWLHVLSSTVLFGTWIGSAFYMLFTSLSRDARATAKVIRLVVIADWSFTTPTVVLQPLTGFYLLHLMGMPLQTKWVVWSVALYLLAGACWLPVVWMQIRMREMATQAVRHDADLPGKYFEYLKWWAALGVVAFAALIVVFYLMVAKPM